MPLLPKQELRQLVSVACTDDALRQLLELLAGLEKHRKAYNAMNLLSGQWQELDENVRLNLLPFKEAASHRTRINAAVLQYLDELPDEIESPKSRTLPPEAQLRQSVQAIAADTAWHYDLFFSFSSKDLEAASAFCRSLRGHGLRVFFSADDLRLRGGHNFSDVIEQALQHSRHFLLFCSPNAMASEYVKLEHDTFFHNYHLPQKQERGFYIAEGPDFQPDLVPTFYRRIQRTQVPEDLLHTLTGFVPMIPETSKSSGSSGSKPTASEELAWEFTTDADTRPAYEKFLTRFPQGFYAAEAKTRLEAYEADNLAWEFASEHGGEKALQKYLSKYPDGIHANDARSQIATLAADLAAEALAKEAAAQRAKEEAAKEVQQAKDAAAEIQKKEAAAAKAMAAKEAALKNAREGKARKKREDEKKKREATDPFHDLMIPIKGGSFDMGDTFGDGDAPEKPVHKVTLHDFHLCKYPVTQAQWKAIMGNNPSNFKGDDLPVETVSWDDAQDFIKELNEKTGKKYRLPSEVEWEYTAREGGKKVRFGNGKDIADPKEMNFNGKKDYKMYYSVEGEYRVKTTPVSQFKPNALGLYDMSGNVWEWCQDVWHEDYNGAPDDGSAWVQGGDSSCRVVRGGSWINYPYLCCASCRARYDAEDQDYRFGLRLAL